MIIRVQSPEGMHRVNLAESASISDLYKEPLKTLLLTYFFPK